jgi:hypothetical protein
MRKNIIWGVLLFLFVTLVYTPQSTLFSRNLSFAKSRISHPQDVPPKKPKYDYMSTFLDRNTKPLGLKADPELEKMLNEPSIKWAIRAGAKHVLN